MRLMGAKLAQQLIPLSEAEVFGLVRPVRGSAMSLAVLGGVNPYQEARFGEILRSGSASSCVENVVDFVGLFNVFADCVRKLVGACAPGQISARRAFQGTRDPGKHVPGVGCVQAGHDAVARVVRLYDKGVNTGYRGGEYFRLIRRVSKQAGVVGVMMGWADHERAYQALIVPCPDQFSIQSRLVVDGKDWKRELGELLDMFGKHSDRGLVVVWGPYETDTDPAIGVVRGEDGGIQGDPDSHDLPPMGETNDGGSTAVGRGVQARWRVLAPKLDVRGLVHTWLRRGGDER